MNSITTTYGMNRLRVKGAVLLLTVVLLLIMVTLVTLYTGKIQSIEHQITLNQQNQKWANASAKTGLQRSLARLAVNKALLAGPVEAVLADDSQFTVIGAVELLTGGRQLVTLTSTGTSADGLASASISQNAVIYPLLTNIPPAPLLAKHGFHHAGKFELVLNPNGLAEAVPLSLWSDSPVVLLGTQHHSCYMADFNASKCLTNSFSSSGVKQLDIADNSASFPSDIMSYVFNLPTEQWSHLRELSDFQLTHCNDLDIDSWGFVWVNGDCEISASTQVATQSKPIILVVLNGQLVLQSDVTVYGLVFSFKSPDSLIEPSVDMLTHALVQGFVLANYQLGASGETVRVVFNEQVAEQLLQNSMLQRVAKVPGSWRDF